MKFCIRALLLVWIAFSFCLQVSPKVYAGNDVQAVTVYSNISTIYPFYEQTKVHLARTDTSVNLKNAKITSIYMRYVKHGYSYRVSSWRSTNTYILRKPFWFRENRQYELLVNISYNGSRIQRSIAFDSYLETAKTITYPKLIQLPLSCEATVLRIALASKNISTTEDELMSLIGYDTPTVKRCSDDSPVLTTDTDSPRAKIYFCATGNLEWGNPDYGFVGDVNGTMLGTGWGVFPPKVADAAKTFLPNSYNATGLELSSVYAEIMSENPVLIWNVNSRFTASRGYSWKDTRGNEVTGVWDHVRVTVGYRYNRKSKSMTGIYLYNPSPTYHGVELWGMDKFAREWQSSGYKAVVVKE